LSDLGETIARHRAGVRALKPDLGGILTERGRRALDAKVHHLVASGVPPDLAADLAALDVLRDAPAITVIAAQCGTTQSAAAAVFLAIGELLGTRDLGAKAAALRATDYYDRLAVTQALVQLADAEGRLTRSALVAIARGDAAGAEDWLSAHGSRFDRVRSTLREVAGESVLTVARLLVVAGQLAEIASAMPAARAA
jgi:glutamate dehydrogenase